MDEMIGKVKLDYTCYSGLDMYSDGKIEDEILEIVKNNDESKYNAIVAEQKKWPVLYHLSHIRKNLLEWYPFGEGSTVLEVGSGCGALTGTIASKVDKVTCIELSKKRSLINAYRNQNYNNIKILVGNFQDVESTLNYKYDYITLIGVLEYAALYIEAENPYERMLYTLDKHLKENGKILIAIENKYGLKYWAGCKEDHVSRYYEGIEGYQNVKSIKTFSKNELEAMISRCHMAIEKFYYPYPDYKLPTCIYSDDRLPQKGELSDNIRNLDNDRMLVFDEAKAYDNLIEDNLYPLFANSFFVVVSKGEKYEKFNIY